MHFKKTRDYYRRYRRYLFPHFKRQAVVLSLSFVSVSIALAQPYLSKLLIDEAILKRRFVMLAIIGAVSLACFLLTSLSNFFASYLLRVVNSRVQFALTKDLLHMFSTLDFNYFKKKAAAENMYLLSYDIDRVKRLLTEIPLEGMKIIVRLAIIVSVVLWMNSRFALLCLICVPTAYVSYRYFMRRFRAVFEKGWLQKENIYKNIYTFFTHMWVIKIFSKERHSVYTYLRKLLDTIRTELQFAQLEIMEASANGLLSKGVLGSLFFYGGYLVIQNRLSLGTLMAVMAYLAQIFFLQQKIIALSRDVYLTHISCERLDAIATLPRTVIERRDLQRLPVTDGTIEMHDLTFGYHDAKPIFDRMSLRIPGGTAVAIAGSSGSGKTTLVNLLLRLYEPTGGHITIDGCDIRTAAFADLRQHFGVSLQEPLLFDDSIENNIRYGNDRLSHDDFMTITQACDVHSFARCLEEKYRTVIGEQGAMLSEGQKQRIALARAVARKPRVLIIDEGLSSVNSNSEQKIIRNLRCLLPQSTLIIISHRLSAVMMCENVFFLRNGSEAISGSPHALLQNDRTFTELFSGQYGLLYGEGHTG